MMQESDGSMEIGELAGELGWSHKHLITQCRDQPGALSKLLVRFN